MNGCAFRQDAEAMPFALREPYTGVLVEAEREPAIFTVTPLASYDEGEDGARKYSSIGADVQLCPSHTFIWLVHLRPNQMLVVGIQAIPA